MYSQVKKEIELSMRPSLLNKSLTRKQLVEGDALMACVRSEEEKALETHAKHTRCTRQQYF